MAGYGKAHTLTEIGLFTSAAYATFKATFYLFQLQLWLWKTAESKRIIQVNKPGTVKNRF